MKTGEADEQLLIEAAQKDPGRFAELYEANFERVYAYVASRVRDRDEAEDVTAEVFHKALAKLPRFEWRGAPFAAWLYRIASNAIADRAARAARERSITAPDDPPLNDPPLNRTALSDPGLEDIERRARLFRMVRSLPRDQHRVIELRFAEEMSIREIAGLMGRTEGAVKQLQFRALETLRARWADETGGAHA
ncbi:MAG TPA: sigma-70 family RNA polymerase sigma factor [Terriglobia bacterium]|nr:sigma-70 family RNA polymerase sigma factor [Terriglobia bacterium]